jgi:RND family efflux transporter MFP subunit
MEFQRIMSSTVSLRTQTLVAALVVGSGIGLWVAREPVPAAVVKLFSKSTSEAPGREGRGGVVPVVAGRVGEARDDLKFSGIGTARALAHVTLYPAVAGEVEEVRFAPGTRVEKGAVVYRLEDRQARLAVDLAKSKLDGAKRVLQRAEMLEQRNVQSMARVLDARTIVEQAEVELRQAEAVLEDHSIEAPFTGIVGISHVEVGDRVTSSTALVNLDNRSRLVVEFDMPEVYLPRLEIGRALEVRTPGFRRRTFEGHIAGIDSRVDPRKRTVVVRAEVDNGDDLLRPGMSFSIDLVLPGKPYPSVPDLALQFANDGNYVWRLEGEKAERVRVEIVKRVSDEVLVSGGLKPGDPIVLEGVQRLRPGRKVRRVGPEAPVARPAPAKNASAAQAKEQR